MSRSGGTLTTCEFDRGAPAHIYVREVERALPLHIWLRLRGGVLREGYLSEDNPAGQQVLARLDLAKELAAYSANGHNVAACGAGFWKKVARTLGLERKSGNPDAAEAIKSYLNGMWFEEYCWSVMTNSSLFDEVFAQVEVKFQLNGSGDSSLSYQREYDILARRGNQMFVVECKSGKPEFPRAMIALRCYTQFLFGPLGQPILVTAAMQSPAAQAMASHLGVRMVSGPEILMLEERLREWVSEEPHIMGRALPADVPLRDGRMERLVRKVGPVPKRDSGTQNSEIEAFARWCREKGLAAPTYEVNKTGPEHEPQFIARVTVSGRQWGEGRGKRKADAKRAAAEDALRRTRSCSRSATPSSGPSLDGQGKTKHGAECFSSFSEGALQQRDAIGRLDAACKALQLGEPSYMVEQEGPAHEPLFTAKVTIGGKVRGEGKGKRKQPAKRAAAEDALQRLDEGVSKTV
ncbi:MAG: DUF1887 family CARF protein [Kiritimatiellae bacterium]|nr:DUF1887 family CARF protein [Kiritimatiellia bacterium]